MQQIYHEREEPQQQQSETNDAQTSNVTALTFLLEDDSQESGRVGEVDRYLVETQLNHDENCLEWWSRNSSRFPAVAELAKRYLCIPATSVTAECIFFYCWTYN